MRLKKRQIALIACIIFMMCLITGCHPKNERKHMHDELSSLEFSYEDDTLGEFYVAIVTTKERSFVWRLVNIEFVKTEDPKDTITYEQDEKGNMHNATIHLSDEGLQKYSKAYAVTYGETLSITNEK